MKNDGQTIFIGTFAILVLLLVLLLAISISATPFTVDITPFTQALEQIQYSIPRGTPNTRSDASNDICLCRFVAPLYTPAARQSQIQGTVRLRVTLRDDGSPDDINALEEGHPLLRESAVDALKKWQFCRSAGLAREHELVITFKFELDGNATDSWFPTEVRFERPATVEIVAPSAATLQR